MQLELLITTIHTEWNPQSRHVTTVIPFAKKGNDPEDVGSHGPAAPKSTIGKLLERLITYWLEEHSFQSLAGRLSKVPQHQRSVSPNVPIKRRCSYILRHWQGVQWIMADRITAEHDKTFVVVVVVSSPHQSPRCGV